MSHDSDVNAPREFALDRAEVTVECWTACARAGACTGLANQEPGVPVQNVTAVAEARTGVTVIATAISDSPARSR
jgi:formylglycine-generating enzyme required for sulfatase activity